MIRQLLAMVRRPAALTATQAQQALADGAVLLDVRERDEWRAGHAPQARHLVLNHLQERLGDLPADRQIITVCRSGRRSADGSFHRALDLRRRSDRRVHLDGDSAPSR